MERAALETSMTYTGHVQGGVVVFDGPERPPEGIVVRVEETGARRIPGVGEGLDRLAGQAQGLPPDLSVNLDKYKRERPS